MPISLSRRACLKLREPFSGLSHLCGAVLGIAALVLLVHLARGKPWHLSGFAIYGATLITLYTASALYHLLPLSERGVERLRIVDRVGIYLLIAGTYTPLCLVPLRGAWGWSLFGVVWGMACSGASARLPGGRRRAGWASCCTWSWAGWSSSRSVHSRRRCRERGSSGSWPAGSSTRWVP